MNSVASLVGWRAERESVRESVRNERECTQDTPRLARTHDIHNDVSCEDMHQDVTVSSHDMHKHMSCDIVHKHLSCHDKHTSHGGVVNTACQK